MDIVIVIVAFILTTVSISAMSFYAGMIYERRNWNVAIWGNDHPKEQP